MILHAGRYARESVLLAYEMIGGVEAMADWASKNKTDFYTKLFPKVLTREVEVHASEGIEDLINRLDSAQRHTHEPMDAPVVDGEYEEE